MVVMHKGLRLLSPIVYMNWGAGHLRSEGFPTYLLSLLQVVLQITSCIAHIVSTLDFHTVVWVLVFQGNTDDPQISRVSLHTCTSVYI